MVVRLLVDSCVWLDLAKDPGAPPVLSTLRDLIGAGEVQLIVPEMVLSEVARNRDRVISEARRGLQSHFKVVRQAVAKFGEKSTSAEAVKALAELDHQIGFASDAVGATMADIETLLDSVAPLPATSSIKEQAVHRAVAGLAPYHHNRNSIGDAIIIETYSELARTNTKVRRHSAFVTHNTKDFSSPDADRRLPHPDLVDMFDGQRSTYSVSLPELLRSMAPDLLDDYDFDYSYQSQPRRLSEILENEHTLFRQVWYNRHWNLRVQVDDGRVKLITGDEFKKLKGYHPEVMVDAVWRQALAAAKRTEDEVGVENLGPWDDFEWGMLNGKLSALRWVLGDDWDMLDT